MQSTTKLSDKASRSVGKARHRFVRAYALPGPSLGYVTAIISVHLHCHICTCSDDGHVTVALHLLLCSNKVYTTGEEQQLDSMLSPQECIRSLQ